MAELATATSGTRRAGAGRTPPVHLYIYWDNSNIFVESQNVAEELEGDSPNVRYRVRIDFANLLLLAHGNRPVTRIVAAGSVPPELATLGEDGGEGG